MCKLYVPPGASRCSPVAEGSPGEIVQPGFRFCRSSPASAVGHRTQYAHRNASKPAHDGTGDCGSRARSLQDHAHASCMVEAYVLGQVPPKTEPSRVGQISPSPMNSWTSKKPRIENPVITMTQWWVGEMHPITP